ncbi:MAG: DUF190 domain-containing protein [Gammaproteobacteria bacterium]|nr:DUF190 domain-containing protein [Gammaproteobacteria bacterium]
MKTINVTVVRVYITESSHLLGKLVNYLKDDAKVRGVTVFRGISGYGDDKKLHAASLVDLSLNLPLVIEFFDNKNKITAVIKKLNTILKPEHIIFWNAEANEHDL